MNYKRETRKGDRQAVKIALYGILLSLAMLLGYVETLVPISLGIPGVKLGLAKPGEYRIPVPHRNRRNHYHCAGKDCSSDRFCVWQYGDDDLQSGRRRPQSRTDDFLQKRGWFSQLGISIIGGVGHNVGQLCVAAFVVENSAVLLSAVLLAAGTATGALIGILGGVVTKRLESHL